MKRKGGAAVAVVVLATLVAGCGDEAFDTSPSSSEAVGKQEQPVVEATCNYHQDVVTIDPCPGLDDWWKNFYCQYNGFTCTGTKCAQLTRCDETLYTLYSYWCIGEYTLRCNCTCFEE